MDVVVSIDQYKRQLKAQGYAASTIAGYSFNLDKFVHYLNSQGIDDLRRVSRQVVVDYQSRVMKEPLARESKALKIRPVKRLFEYLVKTHRLLINPADEIVETSRKNRKVGTVLTEQEIKKLLAQPDTALRIHLRDRTIMEVFYSTAIRLNELINLEINHVDLADKTLFVKKGKGRKQRLVPLGRTAIDYIKRYLQKIRPHYAKKNPAESRLFLNVYGKVISKGCVQTFIRNYGIAAGIKKSVSPHTLRRSCATHMLLRGADIRCVQELLGHKHLSTTQLYTKVMPVDVKKMHSQTHLGATILNERSEDED